MSGQLDPSRARDSARFVSHGAEEASQMWVLDERIALRLQYACPKWGQIHAPFFLER